MMTLMFNRKQCGISFTYWRFQLLWLAQILEFLIWSDFYFLLLFQKSSSSSRAALRRSNLTRASKPLQEVDQFLFTHSWRNLKDKITKKRLLSSFTVRWTTIGPLFIFRTEVFNNDHAFVALKPQRWIQIV